MHHDQNHDDIVDDSMIAIVVVEIENNSYNNNNNVDNNNVETLSNRSSITRVKVRIKESHLVRSASAALLPTPNNNNELSNDDNNIKSSSHDNNTNKEEDIILFLSSIQLDFILKQELQLLIESNNDINLLFTERCIIDNNEKVNNIDNIKQNDDERCNIKNSNDFSSNNSYDNLIHNKMIIQQEIFIPHLQSYIEWNDIPISCNLLKYIGTRIRVRMNVIEMNQHQHHHRDPIINNDNDIKLICGRYYNWDGNGIYKNGSSYQILSVIDSLGRSYHLEFQELSNQSSCSMNHNHNDDNNGSTGNNIWDGSVLMTRYLEAIVRYVPSVQPHNSIHDDNQYNNNTDQYNNNHILFHHNVENMNCIIEFGSGCGVSGICAKALGGSNVILTDLSNVLNILKLNIKQNDCIINQKQLSQTELVQKENEDRNLNTITTTISSINIEQEDLSQDMFLSSTSTSNMIYCECDWTKPISNTLLKYLKHYATSSSSSSTRYKQKKTSTMPNTENTPQIMTDKVIKNYPVNNNNNIIHDIQNNNNINNNNNGTILILIADCIWMEHLVYPLLYTVQQTMETLWMNHVDDDNDLHINVLIIYQRRGKSTDEIFWKYLYEIFSQYGQIHIIDDHFLQLIGINNKPNVFSIISCCCAKLNKHEP